MDRISYKSLGCYSHKQGVGSSRGCLLSGAPKQVAATSLLGLDAAREPAQQLGRGTPGEGGEAWLVVLPWPIHLLGRCCGEQGAGQAARGRTPGFLSPDRRPWITCPGPPSLGLETVSPSICSSESCLQFFNLKILEGSQTCHFTEFPGFLNLPVERIWRKLPTPSNLSENVASTASTHSLAVANVFQQSCFSIPIS